MNDDVFPLGPFRHSITKDAAKVIESYCPDCGAFVAASPSFRTILIAEALHHCPDGFGDDARERRLANLGKRRVVGEPHLIADGNLQRCSVCGYPFGPNETPSMTVAFAEHVSKTHQLAQTPEDVNQAAGHAVEETIPEEKDAD